MRTDLEGLAERATQGDPAALEALVAAVSDDIYGLALRMLGHPADAEDASQEILLVMLTHLASFEGRSTFRTWVWRIATNHLLRMRRSRREQVGFDDIEAQLRAGEGEAPLELSEAERSLLVREIEIGCTQAMLLALDREQRLAFIVVEILELPGDEAAEVLELEAATLRKRVSRARARLGDFMRKQCGLVDERNACRCARQIPVAVRTGLVDRSRLQFATHPSLPVHVRELDELQREVALYRGHPRYAAPAALHQKIRNLIQSGRFRVFDT